MNVPEKEKKKTMGRKHSFVVIEFGADIRMQEEEKWGGGCITCRAPFQQKVEGVRNNPTREPIY